MAQRRKARLLLVLFMSAPINGDMLWSRLLDVCKKHGMRIVSMDDFEEQIAARLAPSETVPIPMVLFCPNCKAQHIDAPSGEWTNPPHRSHECQSCGCTWRPADIPTNGVKAIQTSGKRDWAL